MKLIKIILCIFSLTYSKIPPKYQSFLDLYILTSNNNDNEESDYQLYLNVDCPYALSVELNLIEFINIHVYKDWFFSLPNVYFASPTLRVKTSEGYLNYRGAEKINGALKTLKT